jgi:hypothetical protein
MSLIKFINLIISFKNKISTINKTKKKQWFNTKDEHLLILKKYIFIVFQNQLNDFIC